MRTHVDLFSGIGGFSLACEWAGVETIAFAEIDPYASRVLQRHWPNVRNYGDVRNVPSLSAWLLTAGVPCQPASLAGKRKGAADDRWLWPEAIAAIERIKPAWLCVENPTGILSLEQPLMSLDLAGFGNLVEAAISSEGDFWSYVSGAVEFVIRDVIAGIKKLGYEVELVIIPACGLGAWHRRYRVWILGHTTRLQSRQGEQSSGTHITGLSGPKSVSNANGGRAYTKSKRVTERENQADPRGHGALRIISDADGSEWRSNAEGRQHESDRSDAGWQEATSGFELRGEDVSDADGRRRQSGRTRAIIGSLSVTNSERERNANGFTDQWATEPDVGRVVDGVPFRLDRLRGLGNAIVPQVAYQLIKRMIEAEVSLYGELK